MARRRIRLCAVLLCQMVAGALSFTCPSGYYCPSGLLTKKTLCTAGSYCPANVMAPTACVSPSYCPAGSSVAQACPTGFWCTTTKATTCGAGYYCPAGATAQIKCRVASYCPIASVVDKSPAPATAAAVPETTTTAAAAAYTTAAAAATTTTTTNGTGFAETAAAFQPAAAVVVRNVTVRGMSLGLGGALTLPSGWAYVWLSEDVETVSGLCPAGRYCPAGVGPPVSCPLGTYSPATGREGICQQACDPNAYCPDPAVRYDCPPHTSSTAGSVSQMDCVCDEGYQCVYKKLVNLHVVLRVPLAVWNGDATARAALLQAVADSAGVGVGSVEIEWVAPRVGGDGRRRRLLLMRTLPGTELRVAVRGAERLRDVDRRLARAHALLRSAETRWQRAHRIHVSRRLIPPAE